MTETSTAIVVASRDVLAVHARSFRWASVFLPAERRDDAAVLYALCRLVDDLADEAPDPDQAARALAAVRAELTGDAEPRPLVATWLAIARDRGISSEPVLELIDGVRGDLEPARLRSDGDLVRYGYAVAGTVGLAMCGVLGVTEPAALPHAVDLGVAMQITNICRDVAEDAERGRIYLPTDRLRAVGVDPEDLLAGSADRAAVARVVTALVDLADRYYDSADLGMRYLPMRSRLAILVASRIYRAIGHRLRARGGDALAGRTIVPWTGKLVAVAYAVGRFFAPRTRRRHDSTLHHALEGRPGCSVPAPSPA